MPLIDNTLLSMVTCYRLCSSLYTGRVQHNTGLSADGLGGKVSSESASDNSVGSVRPADLTPVDSVFVSVFIGGVSLCDEGNTLSQVEVDFFLRVDTLDLQQTDIGVLGSESALVAEDSGINVKAGGTSRHICDCRVYLRNVQRDATVW
mmetsp:Transcript_21203/g.58970  ORF Transcript_21203/g.58970 Transcript_21203/m.58970 type:complete len:149 (+) Transcript_21203:152-598(+)